MNEIKPNPPVYTEYGNLVWGSSTVHKITKLTIDDYKVRITKTHIQKFKKPITAIEE